MSFVQDLKNALLNLPPSRNVPFSTKMRTFTIAAFAMTLSSAQRPLQDDTERVPPRMLRSLAVEDPNELSLPAGLGDDAPSGGVVGPNGDEIIDNSMNPMNTMNPMKKTTRWASFKAFLANLWVKFISLFTKTAKVV